MKLFLALLFSFSASAKTIRIAVLDSGLPAYKNNIKLCDNKGLNYSSDVSVNIDPSHHGTVVAGIIADYLQDTDYCMVFIKIYEGDLKPHPQVNLLGWMAALTYVYYHPEIDIVNFSSTGSENPLEEFLIGHIMKNGTVFVAAAGNNKKDLDKNCDIYPACYEGVISVGNIQRNGLRDHDSNKGNVIKAWEPGLQCYNGICMVGTSMSAALHTAKLAKKLIDAQKK